MGYALTRRRFLGAAAVVALTIGLFMAWIGLRIGGARATLWVDDLVTPLAALVACVLCVRARARHGGQLRLFWTLLACATASWAIAEIIWGYYALILSVPVPEPSWADVGYLSAIPLTVAAFVAHPATRGSGTRKTRSVFDGLVVATALLFVSWTLVLGPLWHSANLSTWSGVVTVAYPFGDVVIVFSIVLAIRGMASGGNRLSLWCLLAALLAMALTDSTFTYLAQVANYTSGTLIDTGWVAAYLGIALAAFSSHSDAAVVPRAERSTPSLTSLVAPLVPVLLALTVAAVQIRTGQKLDHAAWLMALGLVMLVLLRQGLMFMELRAPQGDVETSLMERLTYAAMGDASAGDRPATAYQAAGHEPV
jgi:hypothetical protein